MQAEFAMDVGQNPAMDIAHLAMIMKILTACIVISYNQATIEFCTFIQTRYPTMQFDEALAIVLKTVSCTPEILNNVPADMLRKLILHTGELSMQQNVHVCGIQCKLSDLISSIDTLLNQPNCEIERDISKCDVCGMIQIYVNGVEDNMVWCDCRECNVKQYGGGCYEYVCNRCSNSGKDRCRACSVNGCTKK